MVCLAYHDKRVHLVDAETYQLASKLEVAAAGEDLLTHALNEGLQDSMLSEVPRGVTDEEVVVKTAEHDQGHENIELLRGVLSKYAHRKYNVAISLAEPQIYYTYFESDWGLAGDPLRQRIAQALNDQRPTAPVGADDFNIIMLADRRLLVVVRDSSLNIVNLLEGVEKGTSRRISFIESAEISLANLIKHNYTFEQNDLSLIVFVGRDFSRLIFMRGNEMFYVSNIIEAFLDSENIRPTIYSRILLEQDNLNIPRLDNIILTGEAYEVGLADFLMDRMPENTTIDYIDFQKFGVIGMDPILSRYGVAVGAAARALDEEQASYYQIDLTPPLVKEGRKILKLGLTGWLLLSSMVVLAFLSTLQLSSQQQEVNQLEIRVRSAQAELTQMKAVESSLSNQRTANDNVNLGVSILDSMRIGQNLRSVFMLKLGEVTKEIGKIWISQLSLTGNQRVLIKGYTTDRKRVPIFARAFKNASIKTVGIQEIRKRKVYAFELEIDAQ